VSFWVIPPGMSTSFLDSADLGSQVAVDLAKIFFSRLRPRLRHRFRGASSRIANIKSQRRDVQSSASLIDLNFQVIDTIPINT